MTKYRYSSQSSVDEAAKRMYLLVAACAAAVLIGLVLYLSLGSGGETNADIPVVEQGDGVTEPPVTSPTDSLPASSGSDVVSGGDGVADSFTVTVTGADGEYHLTSVKKAEAATLTISEQTAESLSFKLVAPGGSVSGVAYFINADTAACEKEGSSINLRFQSGGIDLYCGGSIASLGTAKVDGRYITGTPVYTDDAGVVAAASKYDLAIRKSSGTQAALKAALPQADLDLIDQLLALYPGGNGIIPDTGSPVLDKNGDEIRLNTELDAVEYYAYESGTGREVILICSADGKIYAGVCDGSEYRYYTNDSAYASAAPKVIGQYAQIRSMTLKYQ